MGISLKAIAKIGWRYAVLYTLKKLNMTEYGRFGRNAKRGLLGLASALQGYVVGG